MQDTTEFVGRLSKKIVSDEKARKHSDVTFGNGVVQENTNGQQHPTNTTEEPTQNKAQGPKAAQTSHLLADYGILGISDDEDSAKWAAEEIKKIPAKTNNNGRPSLQLQNKGITQNGTTIKVVQAPNGNVAAGTTISKIVPQNNNLSQGGEFQAAQNITLLDSLQLSNVIAKEMKAGSLLQNATVIKPPENVQLTGQSYATNKNTTAQLPTATPEGETKPNNGTTNDVAVTQTNVKTTQRNVSGNATVSLEQTTNGVKSTAAEFLPQSNQKTSDKLFATLGGTANSNDTDEKDPSLFVNVTSLRPGQSFDLQMPTSLPSKGTFQDNHFHLPSHETLKAPEKSTEQVQSNSSDSNVLNQTLNKVNAEQQANGRHPYTLLQKLNPDIVAARAEPLTSNVNPSTEVTDEEFREETPAGRTFADNVLEATSKQSSLNGKENDLPGQEKQTEVQQDESLARALNASSVSSIIYSANEAIFDSDKHVFSKKSAQEKVDSIKQNRNKRSNHLRRLAKHEGKNGSPFNRKHRKLHKATTRQVINLGNHFLWFGGQNSADANGFPRHTTSAENTQYDVNSYSSNFLNSANENETPSTTKGYKALQNALSSMESNQEGQGDSESQFGITGNKDWQDGNQGQSSTSVLIQDDAGKPVYQGIVDILKLNQTKANDNVSSEVGNENNDTLIGQGHKASNKTEDHSQANSPRDSSTALLDGNHEVNQTGGPTGSADDTNSTVPKESGADQTQTKEETVVNQAEQKQIPTQQMNSELQDQRKLSSEAQSIESQDMKTKQPNAIIKQLSTNSNEPETYHVIVNDAGKKITNANGHVTVIISGPTANQASMPTENTLLIPETNSHGKFQENDISSNENPLSAVSKDQSSTIQPDQLSHSSTNGNQIITPQTRQPSNNASLAVNKSNGPLSLLQEDAVSALKISEGIEGQVSKVQPLVQMQDQNQNPPASETSQNKSGNALSTEALMKEGHHFVNVGQDLAEGVDGLQMEEVSRPNIQQEQQQVKENLMETTGGDYLDGLEKSMAEQSQDVPTLNIVLDPARKIDGSLSVGGKVVPITSGKAKGDSTQVQKQQLDCHKDPKNDGKTTVTILTCQKKNNLPIIPQSLSDQEEAYLANQKMAGGHGLQLDQVMTVLNDQVKTTINNEMKTESKDIQKMLTGMTVPSSTLMDADEAYSQLESPERSSIGPDETYNSPPEVEHHRRPHHRKIRHFGLLPYFGFPTHLGFPHRRHFGGNNRHFNPFVVMAHKNSDEGFWDYQHNIFIPRAFNHKEDNDEDDNDEEEDNREKHWSPWAHQGHRRGNWLMARPPFHHPQFSPFRNHDLFHLRMPTIFGRSGPWKPFRFHKQEQGTKRTAVVHKTVRGDRDLCKPIIEGPSPPLKGEWEYLGKVLSSCPCRLTDTEW